MSANSFWGLISESVMSASVLEQGVLLFLIALSIVSWAVIIMKVRGLRRMRDNNKIFHTVFASAAHTGEVLEKGKGSGEVAPLYALFNAGITAREQAKRDALAPPVPCEFIALTASRNVEERVRLAMEHALKSEMALFSKHLQVLATAGSASPFIGLFGTVWGIMATFQTLGSAKSASLQVLAPPIAAALIATAVGLAVAIPAVMAYNWITSRIDEESEEANCLMERILYVMRANGALAELPETTAPQTLVINVPAAPDAVPAALSALSALSPTAAG